MSGFSRGARRDLAAIAAFAIVFLALGSLVSNSYYQLMMTLVLIWATMGLSWNVLSGYSGLISFGQAAFFGLGGYTMTIAFVKFGITPWIGIPLGVIVGVLAGLLIGWPTFSLRGHYFGLSMLAYPLAMLYVFEWLGYQEVSIPLKRENPLFYAQFEDPRGYMLVAMGLLVIAMLVSLRIERSRFGRSLLAIKQNEPAAEAAGIDTMRQKMKAIVVSAAIAAAAGGLYANVLLVVTPSTMFGMIVSAQALIVSLFGGVGTLWGPVIGAAILVPLAEILHGELGHVIPGIQGVVYAVAIIVIILVAPEGIFWRLRDAWIARRSGAVTPESASPESTEVRAAPEQARSPSQHPQQRILELDSVSLSYGGLKALDGVNLSVMAGTIHGIIGPNGAGKTTLFNAINGFATVSDGRMEFDGQSLAGLKPHQVCQMGVGRTFQIVRPFARMSVLDNVVTGAFAGSQDDAIARELAREALVRVGLDGPQSAMLAGGLTTKQLRLMELARALASRPRLLLLDETFAGLSHDAIDEMIPIIRRINSEGVTVVIIEHTMHAMVQLADTFSVLDHGSIIANGPPAEVVRDRAVIEAYLGRKWLNRVENPVT